MKYNFKIVETEENAKTKIPAIAILSVIRDFFEDTIGLDGIVSELMDMKEWYRKKQEND